MQIEKPFASLETKGLDKTFDQENSKPNQVSRQDAEQVSLFNEATDRAPKLPRIIECFDCKQSAQLCGYRFTFVPLCRCCRTREDERVLNNRIERLNNRLERRKKR